MTKFEDLRRGVGMFIGNGGTIGYLVNAAGALAVDSQFMNTAEICVAGLKQRAPKGIELLINTHHHGDHTGGNKAFKAAVKHIVCQENCLVWHKKVAEQANNVADQAFGDVTFGESWSTTFGDEKVWAHYFGPGHTSGDAVISSNAPTSCTAATSSSAAYTRGSTARRARRRSTGSRCSTGCSRITRRPTRSSCSATAPRTT